MTYFSHKLAELKQNHADIQIFHSMNLMRVEQENYIDSYNVIFH